MDAVGGKVSRSEIKVPGQKTWKNGMKCGSKKGRVEVRAWSELRASNTGRVVKDNPDDYRMHDRDQFVVAFVPEGTAVPRPPSAPNLDKLSDVTPSTTAPLTTAATSTTAPGATTTAATTATTTPGTTTSAAGP